MWAWRLETLSRSVSLGGGSAGSTVTKRLSAEAGARPVEGLFASW